MKKKCYLQQDTGSFKTKQKTELKCFEILQTTSRHYLKLNCFISAWEKCMQSFAFKLFYLNIILRTVKNSCT